MKPVRLIMLIVAILVLIGVIFLCFKRTFIWDDYSEFLPNDDEPFGCMYFDKMAEATLPNGYSYFDGNPTKLLEGNDTLSLLILFDYMYVSDEMEELLADFVKKGNKLMIVLDRYANYSDFDNGLFPFDVENNGYFSVERLREGLLGNIIPSRFIIDNDTILVNDALASGYIGCEVPEYEVHSYIEVDDYYESGVYKKMPASVSYKYGEGSVYVVANSLLFTNYGVLHQNIARYIGNQLQLIADRRVVRLSCRTARGKTLGMESGGDYYEDGQNTMEPLSYFLSQQPLRWALYTLLAGVCVFMFFTARRRQRIIPTIEAPKNRNLEFVKLIGTIYCRKHDNADLLRKKYMYFKEDLRRRLMVDLDDSANEQGNVWTLSQKTGLDEKFVSETLKELRKLTAPDVSDIDNGQLMKCVHKIDKITKNI